MDKRATAVDFLCRHWRGQKGEKSTEQIRDQGQGRIGKSKLQEGGEERTREVQGQQDAGGTPTGADDVTDTDSAVVIYRLTSGPIITVPIMPPWGVILLAALLGMVGTIYQRRMR